MGIAFFIILSCCPLNLEYDMGIYNTYIYDYDHIVYFA